MLFARDKRDRRRLARHGKSLYRIPFARIQQIRSPNTSYCGEFTREHNIYGTGSIYEPWRPPNCSSSERRASITKEVVGIHVLRTRSLFACDILRRLLRRVSLAKPTSAPLRFLWLRRTKPQFGLHQHP